MNYLKLDLATNELRQYEELVDKVYESTQALLQFLHTKIDVQIEISEHISDTARLFHCILAKATSDLTFTYIQQYGIK